jgi:hypothetical protein
MSIFDDSSNADWWKGEEEQPNNFNDLTLFQLFLQSAEEKSPGKFSICLYEILKKSPILQQFRDSHDEKGRKHAAVDAISEALQILENKYKWEAKEINQLKKNIIVLVQDL